MHNSARLQIEKLKYSSKEKLYIMLTAALLGELENAPPRPAANAAVSIQIIANNTLVCICFHHSSTGVASYTVS